MPRTGCPHPHDLSLLRAAALLCTHGARVRLTYPTQLAINTSPTLTSSFLSSYHLNIPAVWRKRLATQQAARVKLIPILNRKTATAAPVERPRARGSTLASFGASTSTSNP